MAPNLGRQLNRVAGELSGEALANELPLTARQT